MHLKSLCVFSRLDSSFLCILEYYSTAPTYQSFRSLTEEHHGGFQIRALINKAAINIRGQVFVHT